MDEAERAKGRYEVAMNSRPVNEREMAEAGKIGMILQSGRDLRPDEIQVLAHRKAMLENSGWALAPRY